jgi:hypothetical protein
MGVAIKNRVAALQVTVVPALVHVVRFTCHISSIAFPYPFQSIDPVAASSGLIVDAFRCDDYESSATLLVNAAIALGISHLVLTKDDMHM